ncbi:MULTISPECIES: tRNA 2-thiouridine(34) synthase MnmA [unclassified Thioalkalivibrio]|uniref:tRNA 2-thiouridine(34) synthase MnmA n=1 Tax=unclassified Thioalkalivibrio TaxID=2621013 RepID=UPI000365CBE3|nr:MULTISPECIES: tRNA 2-thiouridine(34) synthase MnmA [unclassified Thioalkalivibrio]
MSGGERVIIGLSGGVDSAVAASRLLEAGYRVEGLFMKNWEDDDDAEYCAAEADYAMAREVADCLEIPLHKANFAEDYRQRVFAQFLHEYEAGRTPNPDILCNREIKFRSFLDHARELGARWIATGHYARVRHHADFSELCMAADSNKDQTYFLHTLTQEQLRPALFPLGDIPKDQVRERARELGLPNHARKDSTGICFIGERRFRDFLAQYLNAAEGEMRTPEGQVVGRHQGLMFYTLGQRQGLGIGGVDGFAEAPWYVVDKDLEHNALVVAQEPQHPRLMSPTLVTEPVHWIHDVPAPDEPLRARLRHRQPLQDCRIEALAPTGATVVFDSPQRAATPGQSIAFYRGDVCLGGAVIATRTTLDHHAGAIQSASP